MRGYIGAWRGSIFEELDHPREYFIDEAAGELYYFHNASSPSPSDGTPPPAGAVAVGLLHELLTVTGTAATPAAGISLRGLTFTASNPTFLSQPFKAPSGGDWSFANTAAIVAQGTTALTLDGCRLHELGGNGLLLRGWHRQATVSNCSFDRLGDNAIVTCGTSNLADLSALDVPAGTTIENSVFSNLGVQVKQAGGLYSALSANHTLRGNLFYNGPRAGT